MRTDPALNLAPVSRWTLRDKATHLRLAIRWAYDSFTQKEPL